MKPSVRFLDDSLRNRIVEEAVAVLCKRGVKIHCPKALKLLADSGATIDPKSSRILFSEELIQKALKSVMPAFSLYDIEGEKTHEFSEGNSYFTPGSAAISFWDSDARRPRPPLTRDYIRFVKLVEGLDSLASQSTAFIPTDVPESVADSYRLYLSLRHGKKPVVTGMFTAEAFELMRDLLHIVRGSPGELEKKPLAMFTCCPTSPLEWSEATARNLVDCVCAGIPVEIISAPIAGFISPVTRVGTLIQHTAENLSGVVLAQAARPGAPLLWGGSFTLFDIRFETTPVAASQSVALACAASQIGRSLGLPTQGYVGLSDSK